MQVETMKRNFVSISNTALLWREYGHLAQVQTYKKNATLLHAGDYVNNLYFLYSGEVRMEFFSLDGREKVLLYLGENTMVGEVLFFLRQPCRTTFTCSKPSVVWIFSRECVMQTIFPQNSLLVNDLLCTLATKSRLLNEQVLTMALDDVAVRYCKFLYLYAKRNDQGQLIASLPLNRQELASLLGVHRISLYKTIKELEAQHVLSELGRNSMHIVDEQRFFDILKNAAGVGYTE